MRRLEPIPINPVELNAKMGMKALTVVRPPVWPYIAAVLAIALGVYGRTIAPDLTWANAAVDGGELITASMTLGIPHPPGYSTYVLLGKLVSFFPVGSVAFRYNLFSAVCMAMAAGFLAGTIINLVRPAAKPFFAVAAALIFAFIPLVWSQAVVAEVYALNVFLLSAFLFVTSRYGAGLRSGLLLGLALTAHLTSLFMLPFACLMPMPRSWTRLGLGFSMGLAPMLVLPILALGNSPVIWGDPTTLAGWWWLISGRLYQDNIQFSLDGDRLRGLLNSIFLGPVAILTARDRILPVVNPRIGKLSDIWKTRIILAGTAGFYYLFALFYQTPDASVLLIPGLMLLTTLLAPLLRPLKAFALLVPALMILIVYQNQDLSRESEVRPLAESVLLAAPESAILLTPGDRTIFTLWYFQHIEQQRPDVYLIDSNLFAFDWYRTRLANLYPDLWLPANDDLAAFQSNNLENHAFCVAGLVTEPPVIPLSVTNQSLFPGPNGPHLYCQERNP